MVGSATSYNRYSREPVPSHPARYAGVMELQKYITQAAASTTVRPNLKELEKALVTERRDSQRFMLLFWEWFSRMEAWRAETDDRLLALERRLPLR